MGQETTVEFIDNSGRIKSLIDMECNAWLHEAGMELTSQVKRNTRVDTGETKNSWTYLVDGVHNEVQVGSNLENAIWEEFGTGQYALHGDGRKTEWTYEGKDGTFHRTKGKRPNRALQNAFNTMKNKIINMLKERLKRVGR